jgi:hypothetical protein
MPITLKPGVAIESETGMSDVAAVSTALTVGYSCPTVQHQLHVTNLNSAPRYCRLLLSRTIIQPRPIFRPPRRSLVHAIPVFQFVIEGKTLRSRAQ